MSNRFLRIGLPTAIDAWPHSRRRILSPPLPYFAPTLQSLADPRTQTFRGFSHFPVALSPARDSPREKENEDEHDEALADTPLRRWRTADDYKRAGPPPSEQEDEYPAEDLNYPPSKIIRVRNLPRYLDDSTIDNFLAPYVGVVNYRSEWYLFQAPMRTPL
jgi:hypothetical protein